LKALTYAPTGGIVAAPVPGVIGFAVGPHLVLGRAGRTARQQDDGEKAVETIPDRYVRMGPYLR
jgi:hypothetical protein